MECHEQKHPEQIGYGQISLSYSSIDAWFETKSHKARQKAAGGALSVKLEKYLSRPDYESTSRSLRLFKKDFRKMVLAVPGGFEPRDADSERDLNERAWKHVSQNIS